MEPVFVASGILLAILIIVSYYVTNGIGIMGAPNAPICFILNEQGTSRSC